MEKDGRRRSDTVVALPVCFRETRIHSPEFATGCAATIEEEIFYPAARDLLEDDEDLIAEADVEQASAKELIARKGELMAAA